LLIPLLNLVNATVYLLNNQVVQKNNPNVKKMCK